MLAPDDGSVKRIHYTVSNTSSAKPPEESDQSKSLSQSIGKHLLHLMTEVTKDRITPETVRAACECASELNKVMKTNLELRKIVNTERKRNV